MTRPPGRPRDMEKRQAILDAGWRLFLARGVEGTPVEAIAAAAGVSKVTLYSHYPDKTALFRAAVEREMERIEAAQSHDRAEGASIEAELTTFGLGILGYLVSPPAIDFYNVVAGELRRHEDLARAFYDLGPGRTRANLAALIATGQARGALAAGDPLQAAEALFGLWQGFSNFQLSLGVDIEAIRRDIPVRVARGVAAFLRAHATQVFNEAPGPVEVARSLSDSGKG